MIIMGNKVNTKVCMITTDHSAFDDRIFYKEAWSLNTAGYDVTVIGRSDSKMDKVVNGIRVIGMKKIGPRPLGEILLILKLLINSIKVRGDIYHCHEPESLITGVFIKVLKRKKLIYDVHEYYEQYSKLNKSFFERAFYTFYPMLFKIFGRLCDGVIFVTEKQIELYEAYHIKKPYEVVHNFVELSKGCISNKKEYTLIYEGGISFDRGLKEYLELINALKDHLDEPKLLLVGPIGVDEKKYLDDYVKNNELEGNVMYVDKIPHEKVFTLVSESWIGLNMLEENFNNNFGIQIKIFEYMVCGVPVLGSENVYYFKKFVVEERAGEAVKYGDVKEAIEAVLGILGNYQKYSENCIKAVEKYNWEEEAKKLISCYDKIPRGVKNG